jgi:hypothetical protein
MEYMMCSADAKATCAKALGKAYSDDKDVKACKAAECCYAYNDTKCSANASTGKDAKKLAAFNGVVADGQHCSADGKAAGTCVAGVVSYTAAGAACAAAKDKDGKDKWDWTATAEKCTTEGTKSFKCVANCSKEAAAQKAELAKAKNNASNATAKNNASNASSNASANNASEASAAGGLAATAVMAVLAVTAQIVV